MPALVRRSAARLLRLAAWGALVAGLAIGADIAVRASDSASGTADAAVVLGAAVWGDVPSPVFEARIEHAVDLYRTNRVSQIVFTGGRSPSDSLSEAVAAAQWAGDRDVPSRAMWCETTSRVTSENLRGTAKLARANGWDRVLVVSDPLHLPRAVRMARRMGLEADPSPTPTTRYRSLRSRSAFWAREVWFTALDLLVPADRAGASMTVGRCLAAG